MKIIKTALISVFDKTGLLPILEELKKLNIKIISTGGTYQYIKENGFEAQSVEDITKYPSILGGRVKTLHPKIFGGILARKHDDNDLNQMKEYGIPNIDLVIVDLYPFEETVKNTYVNQQIIEKIDIGGISLIRAAAKNYKDILVVSSKHEYPEILEILTVRNAKTEIEERKLFASKAFAVSSEYDFAIFQYFSQKSFGKINLDQGRGIEMRYGENPHQEAFFSGNIKDVFEQLNGKQISYNNILDVEATLRLMPDFDDNTIAIFKHTNPCGLATDNNLSIAWEKALEGDPVSAFGGIILAKATVDKETAQKMDKLFFEIIIAIDYNQDALEILKSKKNRRILKLKKSVLPDFEIKTALNGVLVQKKDKKNEVKEELNPVTRKKPNDDEINAMIFANKVAKHIKSNGIAITKGKQLIGIGIGQTSRIDALNQAIEKAKRFGFDLKNSVLASDGFFPFADAVEKAKKEGIKFIIQPGGSIRDEDSINFCNDNDMVMVFTGRRHFKH